MKNFLAKYNIIISSILVILIQPAIFYKLGQAEWFPSDIFVIREWKRYAGYYIVLVAIICYNIYINKTKIDYQKLEDELKQTNICLDNVLNQIQACIYSSLVEFSQKMKLDEEEEQQDRISVFGIKNVNNVKKFFGLSRYSDNPNYRELSNKDYDIDKGCMAKGYSNGWHIEQGNIQKYEDDTENYEDYFRHNYNLNHSDIRKLTMKSRYYASISIKKGSDEKGVIVFESIKSMRFDEQTIKPELEHLASKIYDFMELLEIKQQKVSKIIFADIDKIMKNKRGNND